MSKVVDGTEQRRELLRITGLTVELGARRILAHIDLSVFSGEFVGLIGSNGAGKTTLLNAILGDVAPSSGSVAILGHRRPRVGEIGYVPQNIDLDPDLPLTARDFVALGLDGHRLGLGLRSHAFWSKVEQAMEGVGADQYMHRPVGRLSGGQQQRVMIAAAIVCEPALLLLDEPLANLDPANSADIVALLDGLRRTKGIGIMLSGHDINPLLNVLDRVVYLADGRGVVGPADEVIRTEVLSALYRHPIEVLHTGNRVVVLANEGVPAEHEHE